MAITLYDAFYSFLTRTGAIAQGLRACLPDVAIVQSGMDCKLEVAHVSSIPV